MRPEQPGFDAPQRNGLARLARPRLAGIGTGRRHRPPLPEQRHRSLVHGHLRPPREGEGPEAPVRIALSLAGHHWPLVLRADGKVVEVGLLGTALALFDDPELHDADVELAPGEVLCLFTDGLTEARRGRDQFGAERVADVLANHRELSADGLAGAVLDAVRAFHGEELTDDLALIVVRHRP